MKIKIVSFSEFNNYFLSNNYKSYSKKITGLDEYPLTYIIDQKFPQIECKFDDLRFKVSDSDLFSPDLLICYNSNYPNYINFCYNYMNNNFMEFILSQNIESFENIFTYKESYPYEFNDYEFNGYWSKSSFIDLSPIIDKDPYNSIYRNKDKYLVYDVNDKYFNKIKIKLDIYDNLEKKTFLSYSIIEDKKTKLKEFDFDTIVINLITEKGC